jgi:hypothetical protein
MMKKIALATIAVFAAWSVMDFIIHGMILGPSYAATASLWRPMGEMKMGVMYVAVFISAIAFVMIFSQFFTKKGMAAGLKYGLWFGLSAGVSMGYGSYSVMPIPYHMALSWFLGSLIEAAIGGLILGAIFKE